MRGDEPRGLVLVANAGGGIDLARRFVDSVTSASPDCVLIFEGQGLTPAPHVAEQLSTSAKLPVEALTAGMELRARSVLVVPSGNAVNFVEGRLELEPLSQDHGPPSQLDESCTALARAFGERLAFVALAGSLNDGVEGATEVLANGGHVAAAITRGPQQGHLPQAVRRRCAGVIAGTPSGLYAQLEPCLAKAPVALAAAVDQEQARAAHELLQTIERLDEGRLTRFRSDHLLRRAEVRRVTLGLDSLGTYRERLESDSGEQLRLVQSVRLVTTRMFDDGLVVDELRTRVLPRLESVVPPSDELRAWVPRCGRGHDAFTLAIVLEEWARQSGRSVRIFATDEDRALVEQAVTGRIRAEELANVSEDLCSTYALQVNGGWELQPRARRHIVFSEHDVVSDAPYPRLHLVFFRRSLLALRQAYRKHALDRIRFGLVDGGALVLGEAEEPSGFETEFETEGETGRVFIHRPTTHGLRRYAGPPEPRARRSEGPLEPAAPPASIRRKQVALEQLLE
ncbi:MAG: CheR family methyltransferase, partial [Planctomycetota bacterium]